MIFPRRVGLYVETDSRRLRHAKTDLRHEPEPGRLHRRARRRPRLECAERRAVPVVRHLASRCVTAHVTDRTATTSEPIFIPPTVANQRRRLEATTTTF